MFPRSNTSNDLKYINIFKNFEFSTCFTDLVSYLTEDLDYKEIYKQIKLENKNINNYFGDVNYPL